MNALAQIPAPPPARLGVTHRQRDCFRIIEQHIANFRIAPTSREIAKMMGLKSQGRVHHLLVALQERGWITFLHNKPRSIAIVPSGPAPYTLPPALEQKLLNYCALFNEEPDAILIDAVTLFLDEAEGSVAA